MFCGYFRVFLTILAALAAFFAYICRLNLSLTIDEMVEKVDKPSADVCPIDLATLNDRFNSEGGWINNEEHTLAWFARSTRRLARIEGCRSVAARQRKVISPKRLFPLAIEVDVRDRKEPSELSPAPKPDEGVDVQPARPPPNLLKWTEKDRNNLLGAFFFGYVIAQIPAARAAETLGPKPLFMLTGLGAAVSSFLFPLAAKSSTNIYPAYFMRLLLGASQAGLFPTAYVLLCEWLPRSERSRWLPVPSSLSRVGAIVMYLVLPIVLRDYDWESVFFLCGALTAVWCLLFAVFGSNTPSSSYWLSKEELIYIEAHMEPRVGTRKQTLAPAESSASVYTTDDPTVSGQHQGQQTPSAAQRTTLSWTRLMINRPIWMLTLVMFTSEWSNMLLLIKLPGFLGPVFRMELSETGNWSSVLVLIYCIQYTLSGFCASKLEQVKGFSSLGVRKIFEAAAHIMQASGCFIVAFSDDKSTVIVALCLMMFGRATVGGGQCLMPPELSKDYPGTVFAFANTIGNVAGIIGPMTVTYLVEDTSLHSSWTSLWILSGCIFAVCGLAFVLLADNCAQDYCKPARLSPTGSKSISQAQLTEDKNPVEQIFKMDAFSRLSSQPDAVLTSVSLHPSP